MKVVVIGSGPGGLAAALRAAELGVEVVIIEKDKFGGVCLNEGCIPTKKLLDSTQNKLEWKQVLDGKMAVIEDMQEDIQKSLMGSKIKMISGKAEFISPRTLRIAENHWEARIIELERTIIATGSSPTKLGFLDYGQPGILTSKEALCLESVPESLIIIGGGVIGLELATIFSSFGSKVTILEMMETLLPGEDKRISAAINFALKKQGIEILTKTTCQEVISYGPRGQKLLLSDGKAIEAEKILVAVGRSPNSKNLGLEKAGVKTDQKGFIQVNEKMQTNIPGIYAVGDVACPELVEGVGRPFLAYIASREGEVAAENALGRRSKINYSAIPRCVYTSPEIASVGLNAEDAEKLNLKVEIARANFSANALARIKGRPFGFCQLVVETRSQKILGAQIIGERATELIHEVSVAIHAKMTLRDLRKVVFAHPTFSEIIKEAARR